MQVDWFTVIAQIFNFLVLIWLLERFLYQPILNAIDARELSIANALAEAETAREKANQERDLYDQRNTALDAQQADILQAATLTASEERRKLLKEAHAAAEEVGRKQQESQRLSLQALNADLQVLALDEVFGLTRKILEDLSGTRLEQDMVKMFIAQLQDMPESERRILQAALTSDPAGGEIRSAFALEENGQSEIRSVINSWAGAEVPLQFKQDPDLICGLELSAKGQHCGWNIAAYLSEMKAGIASQLAASDRSVSAGSAHGQT